LIKLLIADDHEVVRSGLRSIIEMRPEWKIVAEAADGKDAIGKAISTKPDVAIVDCSLPIIGGIEVTRQIRVRCPHTEVLMFTMHDSDSIIQQALQAGARAYLLKSDAKEYLVSAIEALAVHKPFFIGRISEKLLDSFLTIQGVDHKEILTPRERTLVQMIAEGHSNKEMSALLGVSVKSVEAQRASAMKKLNVASTAGLVRYAIREKIIEP
jgi:DNA-binding NarL/FixJ family response regulator